MIFLKYFPVFIFLTCSVSLVAQVSEGEAKLQELFIDANQQKLLGNYENAVPLFEEILQKDPTNGAAAFELARVYEHLNKDKAAIKFAKKAISIDDENVWFKLFLGDLYQKTNRDKEAALLFENLSKAHPENDEFALKWAFFLVRANKPDEALKVYEDLEKKIGINEELVRRRHILYLGKGDFKNAGKELERLIDAFPENVKYRQMLATFYNQIGAEQKAQKVYRDILSFDPDNAQAKMALAGKDAQNSAVDFAAALKPVFEDPAVDIDLKIKKLLPLLEKVVNTGDITTARTALRLTGILEMVHPADPKAYSVAADFLYHSGQKQAALEKYKKTLELDDTVYLVWEQYLSTLKDLRKFQQLATASENALNIFPNQAKIYFLNGFSKGELKQHEAAIDALQQALFMAGKNGPLRFEITARLALEYHALKKYQQAQEAFENALSINPGDPFLLNDYSASLADRGVQLDRAKELAAKANELYPGHPAFQDTYGRVLFLMESYKAAEEWISKALENGGAEDPDILEHYGDVLFKLKREAEALDYWKKALQIKGRSASLEKKINDSAPH